MKGKIIDSWYRAAEDIIDENGETIHLPAKSYVLKENKYGTFYGEATAAAEDEEVANQWDGCRFAEMKCDIEAYKMRARFIRERAIGIEHACNVIRRSLLLTQSKSLEENETYQKLLRQKEIAWRNYRKAKEQYEIIQSSYSGFCEHIIQQRKNMRKD